MKGVTFTIHDRPGLTSSKSENESLVAEFSKLALRFFNPLPDYQCFSREADALDDKVIITAHSTPNNASKPELLAFTSAVMLKIDGLEDEVFHTGLTVISPDLQRKGLLVELFMRLLFHVWTSKDRVEGEKLWITSITEIPNSLVHIAKYLKGVYPSPFLSSPSATHLQIFRGIGKEHRKRLLISKKAEFDEKHFVVKGCCDFEGGEAWVKDLGDERFWHRDREFTDFYRRLLERPGDEVLQVGFSPHPFSFSLHLPNSTLTTG
jgi:hypothetical protein